MISIYHPALSLEMAQRLLPPIDYGAGPPQCVSSKLISDIQESNNVSDMIKSIALMATFASSNNIAMISPDLIHAAGHGNPKYEELISVIQQDFPNLTAPEVLSTDNGLVLLD